MEIAESDLPDPYEGDKDTSKSNLNLKKDHLSSIVNDLKFFIDNYNNPKNHLKKYIKKIEMNMDEETSVCDETIHKDKIKKLIEKHPYFKNPCNYHIRLLTIMKYLKKKGIDINNDDVDLVVDKIIQEIDGVERIGEGRYVRIINGKRRF